MAYRQTNTKLKTYFKTDNNKNILTLSWKALHAAVIYKLFLCSPNIPRGFITPVNW